MSDDDRRLVYSTDGTVPLPKFERAKEKPRPKGTGIPDDGVVRVGCERRRGGQVTLVYGLAARELERTAAELKRLCGTGGTAKDGIVTLQGDKRDAILTYFANAGRRAKRMGG
jgi:translation initiation factor 1